MADLTVSPNAWRALSLHGHLSARMRRLADVVRLTVLSLYLDPESSLGYHSRGALRPLLGDGFADGVRRGLSAHAELFERAGPAPEPRLDSAFAADAVALAREQRQPLTTRHLVLSAFRQSSAGGIASLVPSRLLLDLARNDRAMARQLYGVVLMRGGEPHPPEAGVTSAGDHVVEVGCWADGSEQKRLVLLSVAAPALDAGGVASAAASEAGPATPESRQPAGEVLRLRGVRRHGERLLVGDLVGDDGDAELEVQGLPRVGWAPEASPLSERDLTALAAAHGWVGAPTGA